MSNKALLVIDMQNALIKENPFLIDEVINNIDKLIQKCRDNNVEVIYIQHNDEVGGELEPNTNGWEISNKIQPINSEKVFSKNYNSAFKDTGLREYLNEREINEIIIVGMQTDYCIDATCKVAFEYGFKVIIPEKTNTTFDNENMKAKELYEYYNFRIFKNRFAVVEDIESTFSRLSS